MFVAIAYAAEAGSGSAANPFGAFVPLILIFGIFYFLMIRPQQKKSKDHGKFLETIKTGDEVVTSGGIYGKVFKIDEKSVVVEIADKVKVRMVRSQLYPSEKSGEK